MKTFFFFFVSFPVLLTLQSTLPFFPAAGLRVDLVFLLVFSLGLSTKLLPGGLGVLGLGLATEIFAVGFSGPLTLSYFTVFLFLRLAEGRLYLEGNQARAVWVFLLALLQKTVVLTLLGGRGAMPSPLLVLAAAFLEGVASFLFLPLLERGRVWVQEGEGFARLFPGSR